MISMESLAPSLEPEHEEVTPPTRVHTNSSLTALPSTPSLPNVTNSFLSERREGVTTSIEPSASKPPPPRTIHGLKWGLAGKNTAFC